MSCERRKDGESCVCETVRKIVRAQNEVARNRDCCTTSCEQSIKQLLSPSTNGNGFTTIPFALYCKEDCEPFIGSGISRSSIGGGGMNAMKCIQTPIFRAVKFVDKDECCVQLELLVPVNMGGTVMGSCGKGKTICDFFPGKQISNLKATGVCITIDLDCFCGIVCLDPVTPLPAPQ
ncbi:CotY/CotZ family spore coat protein [Thalassobacillus sp. CUG 92003]|uniref:CotY/CotZ family spore coat protein n=1 Tax=Thalassobacillus sp. CUG 92003 TaxID=2736641 RepID=UPI0015E6A6F3|nr:CotY/CotZ family spore coat protein [Thalassobacillus sp. CUG 92003]